jgi:hypothetical protein
LILFGSVVFAQFGHWPSYSNPDPQTLTILGVQVGGLMCLTVLFVAVPVALVAPAVLGFTTVLDLLCNLFDGHWQLQNQKRRLIQVGVTVLGSSLFWPECARMLNWLMD